MAEERDIENVFHGNGCAKPDLRSPKPTKTMEETAATDDIKTTLSTMTKEKSPNPELIDLTTEEYVMGHPWGCNDGRRLPALRVAVSSIALRWFQGWPLT
jgi:hypothetical protein